MNKKVIVFVDISYEWKDIEPTANIEICIKDSYFFGLFKKTRSRILIVTLASCIDNKLRYIIKELEEHLCLWDDYDKVILTKKYKKTKRR